MTVEPGPEVQLAVGENRIVITVTAEDGRPRRQTYTVTVTRAEMPVVSVVAAEERVAGPVAGVTVSRTGPTGEPLEVQLVRSRSDRTSPLPVTVRIPRGRRSVPARIQAGDNLLVEDDITVTWTLQEGAGYALSAERASASLVLEESDVPEFAVTAEPAAIREGESATVTVATTNGVRFAEAQTIALAVSGTAAAADVQGLPETLTLAARRSSATATLAAAADQDEEEAETVTVTASHGGSAIGSATVTIESVSHDATLGTLSLSGIDIGTFSGAVTSYEASVANTVATTTVRDRLGDGDHRVGLARRNAGHAESVGGIDIGTFSGTATAYRVERRARGRDDHGDGHAFTGPRFAGATVTIDSGAGGVSLADARGWAPTRSRSRSRPRTVGHDARPTR